jgi:TRAP-type C4-dicarboxylate transport system substrate-binding protein
MKKSIDFKSAMPLSLALLAFLSVFCLRSVVTAQTTELKLGFVTAASETDPYYISSKKFAELVEGYTKGKYKVNLFPSVGQRKRNDQNLTMGTMDLGLITNARSGHFVNAFMVFDLPFIFRAQSSPQGFGRRVGPDVVIAAGKTSNRRAGLFRRRLPPYDQQRQARQHTR